MQTFVGPVTCQNTVNVFIILCDGRCHGIMKYTV
uniref:Uncharacterized protein n=1 Tax=Anguilla anguilla TaxID=7936 RepID=A0A0E9SQJ5_ANGAN